MLESSCLHAFADEEDAEVIVMKEIFEKGRLEKETRRSL